MLEINEVLSRFEGVKQTGKTQWMVKCPCHDDKKQSLAVSIGSKGAIMLNCHAGCEFYSIINAVGLTVGDVTPDRGKPSNGKTETQSMVVKYDYGNGTRKLRYPNKKFVWQHLENDVWVSGRGEAPHVLYKRGEEQSIIYIVEGEKDTDNLSKTGLYCASSENGAGSNSNSKKWFPEYNAEVSNKDVVVVPDNDDIGRTFAKTICMQLVSVAKSVKLIDLRKAWPDMPEKADISDMLEAFGKDNTLAKLEAIIANTESITEASIPLCEIDNHEDVKRQLKTISKKDKDGNTYIEVLNLAENYLTIFRQDNYFSNVKYNAMRGCPETTENGIRRPWTDADDARCRNYIESVYHISNRSKCDDAFTEFVHGREYYPIQEAIKATKWDGIPRVESFLVKWMRCDDTPYNRECSRLMFAGGIRRAFNPGAKFDSVIVLQGRTGGAKSSFIQWIALDEKYYTTLQYIPTTSKTKGEALEGKWICELEELLAIIASDKAGQKIEETTKAFLSTTTDSFRPAFGRKTQDVPRHCIFIGTTNRAEFLTDKTGNRRWFPIECKYASTDTESQKYGMYLYEHKAEVQADVKQCWAEMLQAYLNNTPLANPYPSKQLLSDIKKQQSEAECEDYRVGIIEQYIANKERVCTKEIWDYLHRGNSFIPDMSTKDSRELGEILVHKLGWLRGNTLRFDDYGPQKAFLKPVFKEIEDDDSELPF